MDHLHAVHDVEPTSETFALEQASSFLERKVSHASTSGIKRPVMAAESMQVAVVSKPATVPVTKQEHAFESTNVHPEKKATASEITTHFRPEKLDRKISSRSVHVSPSCVPTMGEVLPIEAATSFKPEKTVPEKTSVKLPEKRAVEIVDKVLGDEKDAPIKSQKPGTRKPLQSVHFSSSQAVTIGAVTPCETTASLKGEKIVLGSGKTGCKRK